MDENNLAVAEERYFSDGDRDAFACIMRGYAEGLIAYIQGYVNDFHAAEDLAQDVFVELWLKRKRFKRRSTVKTYLYSIGRHKALDYIKKQNRTVLSEDGIERTVKSAEAAEEVFFRTEKDRAILEAIYSLAYEKCEVLYLLYFEQMSFDEISDITGESKEKLYALAKRAKSELMIELDLDI